MASDFGSGEHDEDAVSLVRAILSAMPAGCTWLLPITDAAGTPTDFRVAAASEPGYDIYGRSGVARVGALLSQLYPGMVAGPLWQLYQQVARTGASAQLPEFRYEEKQTGVVASSVFDVSIHPVLGGLLVWWHRIDEDQRRLDKAEMLGSLGWAEYDLISGRSHWSPGMYRIFERDPGLGPMSRAEQNAAMLVEDAGQSETAWQTLDSGATSEVTVRFQIGTGVKYLRILSDVARDADGGPVKVYAVLQDVTGRETSRTEVERLTDTLRTRETTALAEHRLAGQLQTLIQPVPREPVTLGGVEAVVMYVPAESALRVGGDWYHLHSLPDGRTVMAIGDIAGHGLDAASGMAHLRFGLIAWLAAGIVEPGALLGHMNRLCTELRITATAVVAVYDPVTRELRWARAGHMPPILARDGVAGPLDRPPGLLLGAVEDRAFPTAEVGLRDEDLLLFYTDGLVERRADEFDHMLDTVLGALEAASRTGGHTGLRQLEALAGFASPDDDTCAVAVRIRPRP